MTEVVAILILVVSFLLTAFIAGVGIHKIPFIRKIVIDILAQASQQITGPIKDKAEGADSRSSENSKEIDSLNNRVDAVENRVDSVESELIAARERDRHAMEAVGMKFDAVSLKLDAMMHEIRISGSNNNERR